MKKLGTQIKEKLQLKLIKILIFWPRYSLQSEDVVSMQLFQSLWIKLQNPNFNKLDPKDQEEIFTNLTETSLTNIIDMMVEAVENNNYDGNVDKTYTLYFEFKLLGRWLEL